MKKIIRLLLFIFFIFPFINVYADDFEITSKNAVLFNLNNNEIIYEKNKDEVIKVASMQKIMTSIVAIEHIDNIDEEFYMEGYMLFGLDPELLTVGFYDGELVTYKDLLYGTLLKSGADGAYSLAMKISGSEEEFVNLMNQKAEELGLKNTHFVNSHGLDEDTQFSTVYDIGIIMKYAYNNKIFKEIISTDSYTTSDGLYTFDGPVKKAHNLGLNYFNAGKTGYTEEAGDCLVSISSFNDVGYLLVTAGAEPSFENKNFIDQKNIYDYYMNNYSFRNIINKGDLIKRIKTKYDDEVLLKSKEDVSKYLNNNIFNKDLVIKYDGLEVLDRSIKKGDKIGKYQILYKDEVLYESDVYSPITVKFKLKKEYLITIIALVTILFMWLIYLRIRKIRRRKI